MKKLLTILFCLGALALFSCEDASEEVFQEIEVSKSRDFDTSESGRDFDTEETI